MKFYKYQGTGNDFIILDDRSEKFPLHDIKLIEQLCNRRFGIGADGLMLLRNEPGYDFRMVYFNSDGKESSMCGNGGRCMARFAAQLGLIDTQTTFIAIDGPHEGVVEPDRVKLKMKDVETVEIHPGYVVLNTGSPHYVTRVSGVDGMDILTPARAVRYGENYKAEGINVNFIESHNQVLHVRTYERGVEDETLSCGTGVTASAIAQAIFSESLHLLHHQIPIYTPGGNLQVTFDYNPATKRFTNIWLIGPAELVFSGEMSF